MVQWDAAPDYRTLCAGTEDKTAIPYFLNIFNYTFPACSPGEAGKLLQGNSHRQCVFMLCHLFLLRRFIKHLLHGRPWADVWVPDRGVSRADPPLPS